MLQWWYRIGTIIHPYNNMADKNSVFFRIDPVFDGHIINGVKEQTTAGFICVTGRGHDNSISATVFLHASCAGIPILLINSMNSIFNISIPLYT